MAKLGESKTVKERPYAHEKIKRLLKIMDAIFISVVFSVRQN